VSELPTDLIVDGFWPIGSRQAGGLHGIGGSPQCVRTHMADGNGLTGGSGGSSSRGSLHLADRHTTDEPTPNLLGSVQLSSGERPSAGDGSARAVITWYFSLKQPQNPLGTVGSPRGGKAPVGFT
jgi:hypothetical protein